MAANRSESPGDSMPSRWFGDLEFHPGLGGDILNPVLLLRTLEFREAETHTDLM